MQAFFVDEVHHLVSVLHAASPCPDRRYVSFGVHGTNMAKGGRDLILTVQPNAIQLHRVVILYDHDHGMARGRFWSANGAARDDKCQQSPPHFAPASATISRRHGPMSKSIGGNAARYRPVTHSTTSSPIQQDA